METHRRIRHYKSRKKVADSFGKGEDGAVDMPVKASGTKISRMLKSKKACPFCFPHGPETPNATAKKNKKSWKNRRKEQYKERSEVE